MRLPFILSRIALVAFLVTIPLLIWPPPIWLAVLCWTAAVLVYRFGMYDPETRLQRLIISLSFGCLSLIALPGAAEIPPSWISNPDLRQEINAFLALFLIKTTSPVYAILLGVSLLAICALEGWRLYLKHRNIAPDLKIMAVAGQAVISYNHDERGYVVEQRVVITNLGSADVAIRAVRMVDIRGADLKTDVYVVGETTHPLGPGKSLDIAANADREMHVMAQPVQAWLRWTLAALDRPGLRVLPLPFELIVRDARLSFSARLYFLDKPSL